MKGLHLIIYSWRAGRNLEGWKLSSQEWQDHLEEKFSPSEWKDYWEKIEFMETMSQGENAREIALKKDKSRRRGFGWGEIKRHYLKSNNQDAPSEVNPLK